MSSWWLVLPMAGLVGLLLVVVVIVVVFWTTQRGIAGAAPSNLIALRGGIETRNPARRHGPGADARPPPGPRPPRTQAT